jgi:tRNA(fMet)-specific endonuclease VapC
MSFVLDTDICSAQIKGHPMVFNRFLQYGGRLHVAMATVAELALWMCRATTTSKRRQEIADCLQLVTPLDVTTAVAYKFGEIQARLFDSGLPMPEMDLLIAATALVRGYTLVTHNTADYARVPGLNMVDWLIP